MWYVTPHVNFTGHTFSITHAQLHYTSLDSLGHTVLPIHISVIAAGRARLFKVHPACSTTKGRFLSDPSNTSQSRLRPLERVWSPPTLSKQSQPNSRRGSRLFWRDGRVPDANGPGTELKTFRSSRYWSQSASNHIIYILFLVIIMLNGHH